MEAMAAMIFSLAALMAAVLAALLLKQKQPGFALAAGPGQERYRFYVSFCDLNQAKSAVEQLFGEDYG